MPTSTFVSRPRRRAEGRLLAGGLTFMLAAGCGAKASTALPFEFDATEAKAAQRELEREQRDRFAYDWAPAARRPDSPAQHASMLEQKLAAFAREVERRGAAGPVPPPIRLDEARMRAELEAVIAQISDQADVAIHVRDLVGGHVVFDHWGDKLLNPASNHKIVTSAAAFDLLGGDYIFETAFAYADGDLFVRGEGDPTLDEDAIGVATRSALEQIGAEPVRRVIVDDSAFSPERLAPGFDTGGDGASYQAPSGALSVNFNTIEVVVYAYAGAKRPTVAVSPESTHIEVVNTARVRSFEGLRIRTWLKGEGDASRTVVEVSGNIRVGGRARIERRRVGDPGMFSGGVIAAQIAMERGGEPPLVVRGNFPEGLDPIVVWGSPPLLEVADRVLAFSNNFIAEQLLRTMGWRLSGEPGDWSNGRAALEGYWTAIGNDAAALVFENGSGLSRTGRLSPSSLVDVIALAQRSQREGGLVSALPVAGQEGTLRARLRKSGKRVRAKTGTMDGVSGLSGVILSEAGEGQVAFSILINSHRDAKITAARRRKVEDALVMTLLDHLDDWELRWAIEVLEGETVVGGKAVGPG